MLTPYFVAILVYLGLLIVVGAVLANCPILAGVAIVENAYDQTARIEAVEPRHFESREKELLVLARRSMARLPFDRADVLLVDRIGKNISGTGMDTNVVGRKFHDHQAREDEFPKIRSIALRGLTPQTHGSAVGMGIGRRVPARGILVGRLLCSSQPGARLAAPVVGRGLDRALRAPRPQRISAGRRPEVRVRVGRPVARRCAGARSVPRRRW